MPHTNYEKIFRLSPNPYMLLTADLRFVDMNDAYLRVTGNRRREDLVGQPLFEVFPNDPDDPNNEPARQLLASLQRVLDERRPDHLALIRYAVPRQTGSGEVLEERFWSATHTPILGETGEVRFILQHTVDVTEVQTLKRALRESDRGTEEPDPVTLLLEAGLLHRAQRVQETNTRLEAERHHLRTLFDQAPGFIAFLSGPDHVFEMTNQAYLQLIGPRPQPLLGQPVRQALPEVVGQGYFELLDMVYRSAEPYVGHGMQVRLRQADGSWRERYIDFIYQPILRKDGTVAGIFVQGNDVTQQKQVEQELRRYREHLEELVEERTSALEQSEAERRLAEAALTHSQRLEAIGKLTGGVAHDFNNVLHIIGGNLQLVRRQIEGDESAMRRIDQAVSAVERGARLASQLLAFARRQPLEPVVVDPRRLLGQLDELLRRALGESIKLETVIGGGLWNTLVDPTQLENAILNLVINARDAMDGEGQLTIEASNAMLDAHYVQSHPDVAPGQYVLIAISDTGCGMSREVQERAFEPFYTTKAAGHGTGLGLSMVYGFVKQSGGHIKLYSEEGYGTTIKIYLPRSMQEEAEPPVVLQGPVEGGTETILVVEDDPAVRATVVDLLTDLGYRVLKAHDGQSALAIVQSGVAIDLLFTDVVMPGPLRSPDLARQAKQLLPDLEVLFTSGYTENAIVHGGRLDPGVNLLSKPYRREDLARKLRHLFRNRAQRQALAQTVATRIGDVPAVQATPSPALAATTPDTLRILFVEDNEDLRVMTEDCVQALGHAILCVDSAESALARLQAGRFDVLITDVNLPGMSGLELVRLARAHYPALQLVVASGYGSEDLGALADNVLLLRKPYDIAELEVLLQGFGQHQAAPAQEA
ncbi:response regulator [Gulbenkiania mobilis]|uniref:histidine kinase n=1 Tax=Gulbenkiania mobilis TaxID=397457 RepID=A0ABY2CTY9_GULMO|nr:PAS domain S-box-containing protein [Gulbenkiania mobilis]